MSPFWFPFSPKLPPPTLPLFLKLFASCSRLVARCGPALRPHPHRGDVCCSLSLSICNPPHLPLPLSPLRVSKSLSREAAAGRTHCHFILRGVPPCFLSSVQRRARKPTTQKSTNHTGPAARARAREARPSSIHICDSDHHSCLLPLQILIRVFSYPLPPSLFTPQTPPAFSYLKPSHSRARTRAPLFSQPIDLGGRAALSVCLSSLRSLFTRTHARTKRRTFTYTHKQQAHAQTHSPGQASPVTHTHNPLNTPPPLI
jgi:hypothetical protein